MPYRIDIRSPPPDALDLLVELGALDIEAVEEGIAAILPDGVSKDVVMGALGVSCVIVSPAFARDSGSVWLLSPRAVRVGRILVVSPDEAAPSTALRLVDSEAFGTGHHPTTALCIEALEEILTVDRPDRILDVGTGSGILALAALTIGVPKAVAVDIDADALKIAAENARLNHLEDRLQLVLGGPDDVDGKWPLIMANVLAAPLIDMAPTLVRRVASAGRLILSGIPCSLEAEVRKTYQHFGVRHIATHTRSGWTALIAQASW